MVGLPTKQGMDATERVPLFFYSVASGSAPIGNWEGGILPAAVCTHDH